MKDFTQKILPGAISAILITAACSVPNNFTKNNYSVTPNPLEMKGDSVMVTITGKVPEKSINAKAVIDFQPYFKTASGKEISLKKYTVKGTKAQGSADATIDTKTGGTISYTDKIPYSDDMRRGQLHPKFTFKNVVVPVAKEHIVEGTVATASLLQWNDKVYITADDYKIEKVTKSVEVYFLIDNAKFNPNFKLGKEISNKKQLDLLKQALKKDSNWVANSIMLNSFASPDGELKRNQDLAQNRSSSSNNYMRKELKKLGFAEVNDDNFKLAYDVSEDWTGFAKLLSESNLPDKDQILSIVNNKSIADEERESQLKTNHAKSWKVCADKLLPKLRRSELIISGSKPMKTDAQLLEMMNELDKLSPLELHHLYYLTSDNNKQLDILTAYINKTADNWVGYNDLAGLQIKMGKLTDAEVNLNKAKQLSDNNGSITANFGALQRAKGDWMGAEKLYMQASAQGADVSYNLGLIAIKRGNYSEAVSQFNKSGLKDFNTALAQLLNGDANGAKSTIDNLNPDMLTWNHYYLRAVCGARTNNQDVLTTNLARAVSLNGDVRNLAKTDAEFLKYLSNPLFEGAIR